MQILLSIFSCLNISQLSIHPLRRYRRYRRSRVKIDLNMYRTEAIKISLKSTNRQKPTVGLETNRGFPTMLSAINCVNISLIDMTSQ